MSVNKLPYVPPAITPVAMTQENESESEIIRERLKDILQLVLAILGAQKMPIQQKMMLNGTGPVLMMFLDKENPQKLKKWLISLSEISRAVSNLDCSREQYEAIVEQCLHSFVEV